MIYIDLCTKIENYSNPLFTIGKVYSSQNANFSIDSGDIELTGWQTTSGSFSVPSGRACFFCNPNTEWGDVLLAYIRNSSGATFNVHAGTKYVMFTANSYNYMKVVDTKGNIRFIMIDHIPNDAAVSGVRIKGTDLSHLV